ncbi:MAG: hypothetical protein KC583_05870 [Myxococcales bacterium]|nr:hypothetical protein [Myxococcales bacterium]
MILRLRLTPELCKAVLSRAGYELRPVPAKGGGTVRRWVRSAGAAPAGRKRGEASLRQIPWDQVEQDEGQVWRYAPPKLDPNSPDTVRPGKPDPDEDPHDPFFDDFYEEKGRTRREALRDADKRRMAAHEARLRAQAAQPKATARG